MEFVCLDGSIAKQDVKPSSYPAREISTLQTTARDRIRKLFGSQVILEEFTIPKSQLRLDFLLPFIKIAVEVHGEQHDKYVKHFHGTRKNFAEAQKRDEQKAHWCRLNDIELIVWRTKDLMNG